MKIKIDWMEMVISPTGKEYKKVTLPDGKTVSCWPNFSQYKEVMPGGEVDGTIEQNGKFFNLKDEVDTGAHIKVSVPRGNSFTQAMEDKRRGIQMAQENKENSIRVSSTARDATLITVTLLSKNSVAPKDSEIQEVWKFWRSWLWNAWDFDVTEEPPF